LVFSFLNLSLGIPSSDDPMNPPQPSSSRRMPSQSAHSVGSVGWRDMVVDRVAKSIVTRRKDGKTGRQEDARCAPTWLHAAVGISGYTTRPTLKYFRVTTRRARQSKKTTRQG
jgi:hypothetical protein